MLRWYTCETWGAHSGIGADHIFLRYRYRRLEGSCYLCIQNQAVKGYAAWPWIWREYNRSKRWYILLINPLTPELNPSVQRCLTRFFYWGTMHLINICVKTQQMHQLFIQLINYVWYLLHVSALNCHPQGAFVVPSERSSVEEHSITYCGWGARITPLDTTRPSTIFCRLLLNWASLRKH
jgi:hypothetical protein